MMMSASHLVPIFVAWLYDDGMVAIFSFSMVFNFGMGYLSWLSTRRYKAELQPRDGFVLVSLAWVGGAAFASVPLLGGIPGLSFTDAYFESVSGLTTTGATVLVNLDTLAPSLNLWRHQLNWFGGMGIIVLAVAILPLLGVGGMQIYKAETPGPMKDNMGPGLNQVGPATNYQVLTDFQCWVLSFTMVLGRLELFTLLILFTPSYWRT